MANLVHQKEGLSTSIQSIFALSHFHLIMAMQFPLSRLRFYNTIWNSLIFYKVPVVFQRLASQFKNPPSMSLTMKHSKSHLPLLCAPGRASINVFNDVLKWLEILECTKVRTWVISYGVILWACIIMSRLTQCLCQCSRWHQWQNRAEPSLAQTNRPPEISKEATDEVIQQVKSVYGLQI